MGHEQPDRGQTSLPPVDFEVRSVGSLVILDPQNDRAERWAADNLAEARVHEGGGFAVELRTLSRVVDALVHDGFILSPFPV
jgi:hypothetical protein